ncbi:MAG: heme o synthase [Actinomycetota bacterium]
MTRFQKLALTTTTATLALVAVGGLVRATGSGLGCSSWPKCSPDRWLPHLEAKGIIEYTHRGLAFVVVVLVGVLAASAWRSYRGVPRILWPSLGAVVLVLFQAALGGIVVHGDLRATLVTAHFATAMALVGVLVNLSASSFCVVKLPQKAPSIAGSDPGFARLAAWAAGTTLPLLLIGTYVRATSAGLAFPDWPLMNGRLVPALGGAATWMFVHRILSAAVGLLVLYVAIRARTMAGRHKDLVVLSTLSVGLFAAQVVVGAANVWSRLSPASVTAHVALSALIWGSLVALATVGRRFAAHADRSSIEAVTGDGQPRSLRKTTAAYFRLTKPRIIVLLLITTVPAMILAQRGMPPIGLILATLVGGSIAAGSANAINCYLDRDIDEVMKRTRSRPLPSHELDPEQALAFGFVLGGVSFFFLGITVNVLAAALALSAIAFYVFVYTMWLKRTSTQNIVIGGAAGAVPALVGWAAVTGTVGLPAWILFAIVFVWTPPHFWALAMRYSGDYAAAGVPMLPVVRGEDETRRQILLYALVLFATSLLLYPVAGMGSIYLATAIALGGLFVYRALRLWHRPSPALSMALFRYSIVYLGLLFAAVAADGLIFPG